MFNSGGGGFVSFLFFQTQNENVVTGLRAEKEGLSAVVVGMLLETSPQCSVAAIVPQSLQEAKPVSQGPAFPQRPRGSLQECPAAKPDCV